MKKLMYYFQPSQSPTIINIKRYLQLAGLNMANDIKQANFTDINLHLNESITQILEYKNLLTKLVQRHCSEIMPTTYCINDQNFSAVLEQLQHDERKNAIWILKPALLNNAEGILLFDNLQDIYIYFCGSKRYAGEHVLQRYIDNPHLLNGHKYTFRMFVIITNFSGVYLYKHGYFNISREQYNSNNLNQLNKHLTNEHLNSDHSPNIWQMPTNKVPNFNNIYEKMLSNTQKTINALRQEQPTLFKQVEHPKALGFFGFDFMLDENLRLWLLEVNHGPCFPIDEDHVLQKHLYQQFWQQVVSDFIIPIAENKNTNVSNKSFDSI